MTQEPTAAAANGTWFNHNKPRTHNNNEPNVTIQPLEGGLEVDKMLVYFVHKMQYSIWSLNTCLPKNCLTNVVKKKERQSLRTQERAFGKPRNRTIINYNHLQMYIYVILREREF